MEQEPSNARTLCFKCGRDCGGPEADQGYRHREAIYCENCYFDLMMPRRRKTHWQYLSSIKSEYIVDR